VTLDAPLVIALVIIAIGFVGTFVPLLPGVPVVFAGIVAYAAMTGFREIGFLLLAFFLILTIFSVAVDWLATGIGARKFGASGWGIAGALIGLFIGLILFPPFGALIGALIGAVALELLKGRTARESLRSGIGALVGYILSFAVDFGIAALMTGIFLAIVLF
jgi:uncharacterized protein YqgC (DUF456 family)